MVWRKQAFEACVCIKWWEGGVKKGGSVIRLVKRKAKSAGFSGLHAIESTTLHGKVILVSCCVHCEVGCLSCFIFGRGKTAFSLSVLCYAASDSESCSCCVLYSCIQLSILHLSRYLSNDDDASALKVSVLRVIAYTECADVNAEG